MTVVKKAAPGPRCASHCTNRAKDSSNRQKKHQARSNTYASPTRKGCVAAHQPAGRAGGIAFGPAAIAPEEGGEGRLERGQMK